MPADRDCLLSRRQMFLLASAGVAAWLPLDATTGDFWNKKAPADWTSQEIDRLITKSPWAKPIKAQYASGAGNSGDGGGYPGGTGTGTGGGYPGSSGGGYPGGSGGGYPGGGGAPAAAASASQVSAASAFPASAAWGAGAEMAADRRAAERCPPTRVRCDGRAPAPCSTP